MSELSIEIEGLKYTGWRDFYLRKSLLEVAHSFSFSSGSTEPGGLKINKHDDVKIYIGDQLHTAGRIDSMRHRLARDANSYYYAGRSYVRDLIDASATVNYEKKYLVWILEQLCKIYGVPFSRSASAKTSLVPVFVLNAESPWEKMTAEAQNQGLIFTSGKDGGVVLDAARSAVTVPVSLEEGVNVTELEEEADGSSQFSIYVVRAEDKEERVWDEEVKARGLHRPMDITLNRHASPGELRKRGTTEMKKGQSTKYKVTTGSWEYAKGKGWNVNNLVRLKAGSFDLDDDLLVSQVEFYLKERRRHAVLTLEKKDVYE